MSTHIAITCIVTEAFVDEFAILKHSFELFHGTDFPWFIRCDRASLPALTAYPNVRCTVFTERQAERPVNVSAPFNAMMSQKMEVMADAWADGNWGGVILMDADLVFTAPLVPALEAMPEDVILVPNYYPPSKRHLAAAHGEYNGGFVFARSPRFHEWWRDAYRVDSSRWNEQGALDQAPRIFRLGTLGENANVGFWRTDVTPPFNAIPSDCLFLHAHLYQPVETMRQWIDKAFALHCVKFLRTSPSPAHADILARIVALDPHGWFEASLRLCGLALSHDGAGRG